MEVGTTELWKIKITDYRLSEEVYLYLNTLTTELPFYFLLNFSNIIK